MTSRDFINLAQWAKNSLDEDKLKRFAWFLNQTYPNFNMDRFMKYCHETS